MTVKESDSVVVKQVLTVVKRLIRKTEIKTDGRRRLGRRWVIGLPRKVVDLD